MKVYEFRCLRPGASWGVAVNIEATITKSKSPSIQILDKFLTAKQRDCLELGFKQSGQPVKMVIHAVDFNPTDYQDEGLICVVMESIAKELNIPKLPVDIKYDKLLRKYIFDFSEKPVSTE
jgi:hypothetical protein